MILNVNYVILNVIYMIVNVNCELCSFLQKSIQLRVRVTNMTGGVIEGGGVRVATSAPLTASPTSMSMRMLPTLKPSVRIKIKITLPLSVGPKGGSCLKARLRRPGDGRLGGGDVVLMLCASYH
jgi:hypothetical protein